MTSTRVGLPGPRPEQVKQDDELGFTAGQSRPGTDANGNFGIYPYYAGNAGSTRVLAGAIKSGSSSATTSGTGMTSWKHHHAEALDIVRVHSPTIPQPPIRRGFRPARSRSVRGRCRPRIQPGPTSRDRPSRDRPSRSRTRGGHPRADLDRDTNPPAAAARDGDDPLDDQHLHEQPLLAEQQQLHRVECQHRGELRPQRHDRPVGVRPVEFRLGRGPDEPPLPDRLRERPHRHRPRAAGGDHRHDRPQPRPEHLPVDRDRLRRHRAGDPARHPGLSDDRADDLQRGLLQRPDHRQPGLCHADLHGRVPVDRPDDAVASEHPGRLPAPGGRHRPRSGLRRLPDRA